MQFRRYGIYVTPRPGALADFGAAWLGWDLVAGEAVAHPHVDGLPRTIADITATPRKYGLHGTIKPPFVLASGTNADDLLTAFDALCARLAPCVLDGLTLAQLGGFIALKIKGDQGPLAELASTTVQDLDIFRAQPSDAELRRRRMANLSPRQEALLVQWGYPYVMDEFRFHITLSGRLEADAAPTIAALTPHITPLLPVPFIVDSLTLVGEDDDGMFHQIHRQTLTG